MGEAGIRTPLPDSQSGSKASLHYFTDAMLRIELRLSESNSDVVSRYTTWQCIEPPVELESTFPDYKSGTSPYMFRRHGCGTDW